MAVVLVRSLRRSADAHVDRIAELERAEARALAERKSLDTGPEGNGSPPTSGWLQATAP